MFDETELFMILPSSTESLSSSSSSMSKQNKTTKKNNKQRFSESQIQSMETMFESETKLEPAKKLQLAKELGLQPRQIAIWFQNRRARWKTKQLHKEYTILHNSYNNLASQFDILKKEKQSLLFQIQNLSELLEKKSGGAVVKDETWKEENNNNGFLLEDNYLGLQIEDEEMGKMVENCLLDQCGSSYNQWWDV
ncbi:homeobox-leucine zipper protein ATHB-12-like [Impatiens glandulifera]|uniref:homeobox-leucine zipper protein ATHB-12-like n=1 Tax=Impatiens glandulifera TaxID=253017 RepID=UPI001FB0D0C4|nr:homeobox-leucine zipper protein ATHB-12-like [Impatiens glandulifera]